MRLRGAMENDVDQSTLEEVFIEQAEWREQKAVEFPNDDRNAEAAKFLRELAATSQNVPDEVINAAVELSEDCLDAEVWNEMVRSLGFHSFPETAEAFLRSYIASRTG